MEQYYYNHMDKQKQAAYHGILQGITSLADEFQIPALDGEDLYNVFFQLRLDHPEIFGKKKGRNLAIRPATICGQWFFRSLVEHQAQSRSLSNSGTEPNGLPTAT